MQLHMSRTSYAYMPWTTQSCSCTCLELLMPTCLGPLNHAVAYVSNFLCLHALDHSIMQLHVSRTSYAYMPWTTQSCSCTCLELLVPTCPQHDSSRQATLQLGQRSAGRDSIQTPMLASSKKVTCLWVTRSAFRRGQRLCCGCRASITTIFIIVVIIIPIPLHLS